MSRILAIACMLLAPAARADGFEDQIRQALGRVLPSFRKAAVLSPRPAPRFEAAFVPIRPGSFVMGSPADEKGRFEDEAPHLVDIARGFDMQATEVTQRQFKSVMGYNPSRFVGDENPVENVTRRDALRFAKELNLLQSDYDYRLPTEAEWEYAARAGSQTAYCFGSDVAQLKRYAWYEENSEGRTHPVAGLLPNRWGLYDMHGNVHEWVSDWREGKYHVFRGGSWMSDPSRVRSARRSSSIGGEKLIGGGASFDFVGFRLVRTRRVR